MRCLDCGNKAKRDCLYYRCRSCCKGHGFRCPTHVKSTWIPVSTRQLAVRNTTNTSSTRQQQQLPDPSHHQMPDLSTSSGFGGHFPMDVSGEAIFTCARVATTSRESEVVDQYAYETSINIGGHVFRGILHDQGPYRPMVNSHDMYVHNGDEHSIRLTNINNPTPSVSPTTHISSLHI